MHVSSWHELCHAGRISNPCVWGSVRALGSLNGVRVRRGPTTRKFWSLGREAGQVLELMPWELGSWTETLCSGGKHGGHPVKVGSTFPPPKFQLWAPARTVWDHLRVPGCLQALGIQRGEDTESSRGIKSQQAVRFRLPTQNSVLRYH